MPPAVDAIPVAAVAILAVDVATVPIGLGWMPSMALLPVASEMAEALVVEAHNSLAGHSLDCILNLRLRSFCLCHLGDIDHVLEMSTLLVGFDDEHFYD